ncbi:type III secretion system effector protein OrgC [Salmonella enterica]|nr:type III secretion system effector protein OrgC [Salmonella enterica]
MVTSVRTQPPVIMPGMQTEIKTQATNLAANLSAVRESATTTLSGEIKGPQLEDFPALIKQASLDALFKCGKDAEALKEVFTNSNNVAGKKAIMEFAGLFRSALNATSDSPEAKTLLMKVGAEYTAQIIKDGLKEKSAFGPWLPETKKAEAKLENLEKQLLDIIKNNTGGELSKLSTNLVMQEVMPYIASCIEHNFGCTLDPLTRSNLTHLVDKAAAKAVEALDMCHQKLTQEQGTSVGREARHLEMQTLIPLLLRNVFAQIPADKLPDPKIPEPAAGPVPDGGKKAEPTGINININIDSSNHSVDNSKHINNSRSHVDNSQRHIDNSNHDNSRKTIDNSRTFIDNSQRNGGDVDLYDAFYQRLLALPESASSETLKDSIYQEMNAFKDPNSGDSAFVSFEQQTAMLQNMLAKVEPGTHLYEALNGVLVGTMNAQSQMTSWMQEIILSGGENKEAIDW